MSHNSEKDTPPLSFGESLVCIKDILRQYQEKSPELRRTIALVEGVKKSHLQRTCERLGWEPNVEVANPLEPDIDQNPNAEQLALVWQNRGDGYRWTQETHLPDHLRAAQRSMPPRMVTARARCAPAK